MDECSFAAAMKTKINSLFGVGKYTLKTSFILTGLGVDLSGVQPALNPCTPQDFVYVLEREKRLA